MKKNNNRGFTLAELLIVVAIIAVLVAIAIPVFTHQLEKSREATDAANVRSAIATLVTEYLTENKAGSIDVTAKQRIAQWQTDPAPVINQMYNGSLLSIGFAASTDKYTVSINDQGSITVTSAGSSSTGGSSSTNP